MRAAVIASAGLLLAAAILLTKDASTEPIAWGIAVVSFLLLLTTKIDTSRIIRGGPP